MSSQSEQQLLGTLQDLDLDALTRRRETVESDVKNLEEELAQREELLTYIDELIKKSRTS
jgi:hypothetical protein